MAKLSPLHSGTRLVDGDDKVGFTISREFQSWVNQIEALKVQVGTDYIGIHIDDDGIVRIGDGVTNYTQFDVDGEITLAGTARVQRHHPLGVGVLVKHGANDPTLDNEGLYTTQDYQAGAIQELFYEKNVPWRNVDGGDKTVELFWFMDGNAATAAKFVRWGVQYKSTAVGEAVAGVGTSFTQDVASLDAANYTAGTLIRTELTTKILGADLTAHDCLAIRIYRDGVADDCADEARLVAVRAEFLMDSLGKTT